MPIATIGFQLRNGFEPIGVLAGYLPEDRQSLGYAAHMVWRNPYVDPDEPPRFRVPRNVESVRIATCQFQARAVQSFERSEEHTSELPSLMRNSYAVFCLQKKK